MTLDELEDDHNEYLDWVEDTYGHTFTPPPIPAEPVRPVLRPIRRPGTPIGGSVNVPEATKIQLNALRDGVCPTCGQTCGCYVFDNLMLFYCHVQSHHRFKETLNWS